MRVLLSIASLIFISGEISASNQPLHYPVQEDVCAPEPVCKQCVTGTFPADICCREVKNYYKLQLANPYDCSSYFQCANDRAVHLYCPSGLHWSTYSERCEWPEVAKCNKDKVTTTENPEWDSTTTSYYDWTTTSGYDWSRTNGKKQ